MGSIVVFIFLVFVTTAYGRLTKRDFCDSLAAAVILQTILGLCCGMVLGHISWSIWIAVILSCVVLAAGMARERADGQRIVPALYRMACDTVNDRGFLIFTILFFICVIWNQGKCFTIWDEFSHWGMFLKETLRLDQLYCTSPLNITHKDYVPAVTVFEAMWCRLTGGYREADAYSAIQMLQFAFLLPVILHTDREDRRVCETSVKWKTIASDLLKTAMLIMLLSYTSAFFYIFHTIYQDSVVAVALVYVMYTAGRDEDHGRMWRLVPALTFLMLTKTAAILFLPTVVVYLAVNLRRRKCTWRQTFVCGGMSLVVPLGGWAVMQAYIKRYVETNSEQSLGGLQIGRILSVILHDGSIPYQKYFEYRYFGNQLIGRVFGFLTPAVIMVITVLCLGYLWKRKRTKEERQRIFWLGMWMSLTYFYYLLAQWMIYLIAFSEYEATNLFSFQRYMLIFLLAPIILTYREIIVEFGVSGVRWTAALCILIVYTFLVHRGYIKELLPGRFSGDGQGNEVYRQYAEVIAGHVPEGLEEPVLMVICGDDGRTLIRVNYYASPRAVSYVSPGEKRYENDFYSADLSTEEFIDRAEKYDWIYFVKLDEQFEEKYKAAFDDQQMVREGMIYRLRERSEDGRIVLEQ